MEKIIGINPVLEILRSDKTVEKIEVYKGTKKDTIKEILNLASKRNIKVLNVPEFFKQLKNKIDEYYTK